MGTGVLGIRLFGEFAVELDGRSLAAPAGRARELLAWFALAPGPHARGQVAGTLWPDVPEQAARASLRSTMWALRAALGAVADDHLIADRTTVGLRAEHVVVDLAEFARLAADGRARDALALSEPGLLPSFGQEWAVEAQEEHEVRLAALLLAEAEGGNDAAALAVHAGLRRRLAREHGTTESRELAALARRLRVGAAPDAPEPRPTEPRPTEPRPSQVRGRAAEVLVLDRAWHEAARGRGSVVVLAGDGGMGKTLLVTELRERVGREGARTLTGYSDVLADGVPFMLWADVLSELSGLSEPDAPAGPARPGRSGIEPRSERLRQLEHATQLLLRTAREEPLLLVLEDVHRADPSSLDLLAYAGRRLAGQSPCLLVLTRRRLPGRSRLEAALSALHSSGSVSAELELGPLPAGILKQLALEQPGLTQEQATRIARIADGNPLLAVEAARAAALRDADLAAGLRGAVRAALARLTPSARQAAGWIAAAGRPLSPTELAALPLRGAPAPAAAAEALSSGLLLADAPGIGFRHALLRDACYAELAGTERAAAHAALVSALDTAHGDGAPATGSRHEIARAGHAAELARHLRAAGQLEAAADRYAQAAAAARRVCALPEAAGFLREALALVPEAPQLLLELAEVEAWEGRSAESDAAFGRALELIAPDDTGALVDAWLRRGHWMHGGLCYPHESRRSFEIVLDLLDREPAAASPRTRARALAGLAWANAVAGDPAEVEAVLAQVAKVVGHDAPDDLLAHHIGLARGHALIRAGRFTESYAPLVAAGAAAGRAGRPELAYSCLINAASAAACTGDWTRALDYVDRSLALVVPNGLLRNTVLTHSSRVHVLRRLGRPAEARQSCAAAEELAARTGLADLIALTHHDRGQLALDAGDPARAATELAQALDCAEVPVSRPRTRLLLAEALARAGHPEEAAAQLRETALEPVSIGDFPETLVARMNHVQGLVALAEGDRGLAARRLRESEAGWARCGGGFDGEAVTGSLIDLGRPPISALVEPARELAAVRADLAALAAAAAPGA